MRDAVTTSCGCVFCDFGVPKLQQLDRRWVHVMNRGHSVIVCPITPSAPDSPHPSAEANTESTS
jgi:hypothetical protein